jgi:hypothetical protein
MERWPSRFQRLLALGIALACVIAWVVRDRAMVMASRPAKVGTGHDHTAGPVNSVPPLLADPGGWMYAVLVLLAATLVAIPVLMVLAAALRGSLIRLGLRVDDLWAMAAFAVAAAAAASGVAALIAGSFLSVALAGRQEATDLTAVVLTVLRYAFVVTIGFLLLAGSPLRRADAPGIPGRPRPAA